MCNGDYVRSGVEKTPKYKVGEAMYFFVKYSVKRGVILEIDNRSLMTNKVMYLLNTNTKSYWREEQYLTDSLEKIEESINQLKTVQ